MLAVCHFMKKLLWKSLLITSVSMDCDTMEKIFVILFLFPASSPLTLKSEPHLQYAKLMYESLPHCDC